MAEKVNLQQQIQQYRQTNSKLAQLSDKQVLSIMVKSGKINLTEAQKRSIFSNGSASDANMELKVEGAGVKQNPAKTIYLQSGRKVVYLKLADGRTVMKYFGADGTQLKPDYFKKVEGKISISADGQRYTITKNGKKSKLIKAKNPTLGAIDQRLARLNKEEERLNRTKKEQGIIGSGWDWIKNTTGIGDSSDKAQKQIEAERNLLTQIKSGKVSKSYFKEVTGLDYSKANLEKFQNGELSQATAKIDGYAEGQEMAVDVAGDIVSGVAAVGIYTAAVAAAPVTGGASIAVGVAAATASGALIKSGVKALDTVGTDREYTLKDFRHDAVTGAFSGALAPVTAGFGGAAGKAVATRLGIQAVKQIGKEVAEEAAKGGIKQTVKTALTNPAGYEYVGGNVAKRSAAWVAEAVTDGALGGAIDGGFREGVDQIEKGEDLNFGDIASAAVEGGIGGAIGAPVIGGGMKAMGKGAQKAFGKNNVHINADGNRVRVNNDRTVVRIDENGNEITENIVNNTEKFISIEKELENISSTTKPVIKTRQDFETKFPILKEHNLIEFIEEYFRKKYPDRDINEFYSLPVLNNIKFTNHIGTNKANLRSLIDSMDNLKEFPYEKYEKFLSGSSPLVIASLKFNDGITTEILDKYMHLLTPENFTTVVGNLTKENIAILDKYIVEGKITPENISKLTKFNTKFDSMLTKYFGEKIDNELFEKLIKLNIKDYHYNYIVSFENFIDKDNIVRILRLGQFDLQEEKLNIPEELIGTIITKENFIDISSKLNNLLDLKLEKLADFKDINWDEYRNYVIAHAKDGVTSDILELMRQGVEPRILNILRASWPATDHGGEEADFAKYIINMSKMKEWRLIDKLELYEQCNQPLMIERAQKDPFVENLFKEFKSRLEAELLHPVDIIETPKITKDNFMQLISNNPVKAKKLENMNIQEIKDLIYAEFPELKTLTQDDSFAQLLQDIAKSSEFKNLDDRSKFNIKLAAILSTIKPEYANTLMEKLNLQYSTRRDVLDLLGSTKHFSSKRSTIINPTHVLATLFPTENKLNAAKLFAKIKDNFILSEDSETMIRMLQDSAHRSGIPVFSTRLPKGRNLEKIPTVSYNGKEYKVLNLLDGYDDLSAFGFVPGTTLDNFSVNATFVRDVNEANTMFLSGNPIISGIPSTSKIGLGQNASFEERTFAIIVEDVDKTDYIFANKRDTDIGHGVKDIRMASQKMFNTLGEYNGLRHRIYMADLLKERLKLTHEQYGELYRQIVNKKYLSQIKSLKIDGKEVSPQRLAKIKTALEEVQRDLVNTDFYKGNHNETNLSRPEVNQDFILAKVNNITEIPQEWLDYAERNNKKFILIGNSQKNVN